MKSIATIGLVTTVVAGMLGFTGCQSTKVAEDVRQPVTIRIEGPIGMSFTGTVKGNGVEQQASGIAPTKLEFASASRGLSCNFQQGGEPGILRFEVYEGTRRIGNAATTGPRGHCRFSVHKGLMGGRSTWRVTTE